MTPALPPAFLGPPIAHRALHDKLDGRPENGLAAIAAAVAVGYGIEIDVQQSLDGRAMVFHDYDLSRLTDQAGPIRGKTAQEAGRIGLKHGHAETIPTLAAVLRHIAGRVPVLIELKDQDGNMGANIGALEADVAKVTAGYSGPLAVMSFNPHSVREMGRLRPDLPRGLVTCAFAAEGWPLSPQVRDHLRDIPDFKAVGASFISHEAKDLTMPRVSALRTQGVPVLCWTVRSAEEERRARTHADNITFENYLPALPA